MKKKLVCLFTAFIIAFSCIVPVSAADGPTISTNAQNYFNSVSYTETSVNSVSFLYTSLLDGTLKILNPKNVILPYPIFNNPDIYIMGTELFNGKMYVYLSYTSQLTRIGYSFDLKKLDISRDVGSFPFIGGILNPDNSFQLDFCNYYNISYLFSASYFYPPDFINNFLNKDPVFDDSLSVYPLNIDVEGFINFYKNRDNQYFNNLVGMFGNGYLALSEGNLDYIINYYNSFGCSNDSFVNNRTYLKDILKPEYQDKTFNSSEVSSIKSYLSGLCTKLRNDYQDYLKSKTIVLPSKTPNMIDDPSVLDDSDSDDIDVSILREILRVLVLHVNNTTSNFAFLSGTLNNIVSLLADLNFNFSFDPDVDFNTGILGINNMIGLLNTISLQLDHLIDLVPDFPDAPSDPDDPSDPDFPFDPDLPSIPGTDDSSDSVDRSFLEWLFVPTFDEFDDIYFETVEKFPILSELNYLPDSQLDDVLGLPVNDVTPVAYANIPDWQNPLPDFDSNSEYGFNYSEDEITTSDLFTFSVPAGQSNNFLSSLEGLNISIINFKKFEKAILFFKGIIAVLSVYAFSKWLVQYVPKLITGSDTSGG